MIQRELLCQARTVISVKRSVGNPLVPIQLLLLVRANRHHADKNGYFTQTLPADSYFVADIPAGSRYINPKYQEVTLADNETKELEFEFESRMRSWRAM